MNVRIAMAVALMGVCLFAEHGRAAAVTDEAINAIVQQIDTGRYQEAIAAAKAAMASYKPQPTGKNADKAFVRLLVCGAAAYIGQKDYKNAQLMAVRAFNSAWKGRSITMNLAAAEAQVRTSALHAASIMRDYCEEHPDDVEAFALFGAALDRASQNRTSMKAVDPLIARYNAILPKIEASKPGQRRWGATWVSEIQFRDLKARRDAALSRVEAQKKVLSQAQSTAKQRQQDLRQADWDNGQLRRNERRSLDYENRRVNEAERAIKVAEAELAEREKAVPYPDWSAALVLTKPDAELAKK